MIDAIILLTLLFIWMNDWVVIVVVVGVVVVGGCGCGCGCLIQVNGIA